MPAALSHIMDRDFNFIPGLICRYYDMYAANGMTIEDVKAMFK
jgi:hypothetical protein